MHRHVEALGGAAQRFGKLGDCGRLISARLRNKSRGLFLIHLKKRIDLFSRIT